MFSHKKILNDKHDTAQIIKSGFNYFSPDLMDPQLTQDELKRTGKDKVKQEAFAKEKLLKAKTHDDKLKNVLIVVSLFAEYYEHAYLDSLIATLKNYYENPNNSFKSINFYVTGLLQRHNFWNFTQAMTAAQLSELVKGIVIIPDLDVGAQLADQLAQKLWHKAIYVENEFIFKCNALVKENIADCKLKFYRWNDLNPISSSDIGIKKYRDAIENAYYQVDQSAEIESMSFRETLAMFVTRVVGADPDLVVKEKIPTEKQKRQEMILTEARRVLGALKLPDLHAYHLAKACCLNFVLEECAGFPLLNNSGWSSLAYPTSKNELNFFRQTEDLMLQLNYITRRIEWIGIHFEKVRVTPQFATNLAIKYPVKANITNSTPLAPTSRIIPDEMESLSLDAKVEGEQVSPAFAKLSLFATSFRNVKEPDSKSRAVPTFSLLPTWEKSTRSGG